MIELNNIYPTDTVGQLRGQINTMQQQIMYGQPMIGVCLNPSVYFYNNGKLVYSITKQNGADYLENIDNYLNALILPNRDRDECLVVGFTGLIHFLIPANEATIVNKIVINIQAIKGIVTESRSHRYVKFIRPDLLGLNHKVDGNKHLMYQNCQYMHITQEGQATVPPYTAYISTIDNIPGKLDITLSFDKGNLDFTNGANGFITF